MITYLAGLFFILLVVFVAIKYCRDSYNKHLDSFIELNNNITAITTKTDILSMNKVGLDFFNFKSFSAFKKKNKYLSKLFAEIETEDAKFIQGIDWVTKIDKMQNIQVEMHNDNLKQIFYMQVSKIKTDRYMISFFNVSRVMAEKEAIMQVAQKDDLTQIYNRTMFNTLLSRALRRVQVYNEPFTLILFDIDHFKQVNDNYGHNVGDQVLIHLSSLVKSELRHQDSFARWGGEEFIILSESSTQEDAYELASRLREIIEAYPFEVAGKITCSFGVCQYAEDDTSNSLLKRVDDALYQAKDNGRNRVCM